MWLVAFLRYYNRMPITIPYEWRENYDKVLIMIPKGKHLSYFFSSKYIRVNNMEGGILHLDLIYPVHFREPRLPLVHPSQEGITIELIKQDCGFWNQLISENNNRLTYIHEGEEYLKSKHKKHREATEQSKQIHSELLLRAREKELEQIEMEKSRAKHEGLEQVFHSWKKSEFPAVGSSFPIRKGPSYIVFDCSSASSVPMRSS
jgi:hypothetical protein